MSGLVIAVGAAWAGQAAATYLVAQGLIAAGGLAFAAVSVGVATAISLVASKFLQSKPPEQARQTAMYNPRQPVSYMERVYGIARKGGPVAVTNAAYVPEAPGGLPGAEYYGWPVAPRERGYRIFAVILASHEIDGVDAWYVDDRSVTRSDNGFLNVEPYENNEVSFRLHTGAASQTADALMVNAITVWTPNHDMAGLAYVRVLAQRMSDEGYSLVYPNGMPIVTPVIRGNNKIYDPRDGQRKFTRNWALCFAHELVEYQGLAVDWDEVGYEADQCDMLMPTGDGTLRPRWRADGFFADDMSHADIRGQFLTAADGFFYERADGKVGFKAGRYTQPTITLGAGDFLSIQITSVRDIDTAGEYITRYVEPSRDYVETPSGTWVVDEAGSQTRKEISAGLVSGHYQASALSKRTARADHAKYRISGVLKFVGLDVRGERFVRLELPEMGISCALEVQRLTLNEGWMTWNIEAISTEADDWVLAADEEPMRPLYDNLTSTSNDIPAITSLQVTVTRSTSGAANVVVRWDEQDSGFRQRLRYSISGTDDWQMIDIVRGASRYEVTGLLDGEIYEFQIQNLRNGKQSFWSQPVIVRAVANTSAPPPLLRFEVTGGSGQAVVDFDTPNNPNYSATRVYRAKGSTKFADATVVQTVYGSPNISDGWTDNGLSTGSYSYWGLAINASGVGDEATIQGPVTVSVL